MFLKRSAEELNQEAETYLSHGKLDEAEAACLKALKIEPKLASACKTLGNVMKSKGEIELALSWYAKAIAMDPNFAKAYANLGSLYAKKQQWEEAINYFQKALKLEPNFAGYYRNLARLWQQLNREDLAIECWRQALIIEPDIGIERAISFYQEILDRNPQNLKVRKQLTDILIKKGEIDRAIALLRRGIELNPKFPWFHYNLGEAFSKKQELQLAIAAYFRAVALQPNKFLFRQQFDTALHKKSQLKPVVSNKFNPSDRRIYFTVLPVYGAGFTDQLIQFTIFYKLGLCLSYQYIHTDFSSHRSSQEIYNFLGFNQYWQLNAKNINLSDCDFFCLDLEREKINLNAIDNVQKLQQCCEELVLQYPGNKNKLIVIFNLQGVSEFREKLLLLINSEIPGYQDNLSLRKIYFEVNKNSRNLTNYFTPDKLKLLIHIRAGDLASIKTPWGDFIKSMKVLRTESRKTSQQLDELDWFIDSHELIEPDDYYRFALDFISGFGKQNFSTCVFSDGYQRSFDFIRDNLDKIKLTPKQTQQILDLSHSYETEKFSLFSNLENCTCIIGESDEKLFDLINCSLMADIFIVAYQQRMIPKFLANYYDLKRPQLLFILFKNHQVSAVTRTFCRDLALDSRKATVIPVNLEDYNMEELIEIAKKHGKI
jgi:tetratricopeptide (TPR) repeat protein